MGTLRKSSIPQALLSPNWEGIQSQEYGRPCLFNPALALQANRARKNNAGIHLGQLNQILSQVYEEGLLNLCGTLFLCRESKP